MSYYFRNLIDRTEATMAVLAHHLDNPVLGRVDAVVGIGLSGTLGLLPLHMRTGRPIIALRKKGTPTHGGTHSPSDGKWRKEQALRYILVDDFIATGKTVAGVLEAMGDSQCVGVLCYQANQGHGDTVPGHPEIPVLCLGDEVVEVDDLLKGESNAA